MKPWRLTPAAEESLVDIALWTIDTFGPAQASAYEDELIARCQASADGGAISRDCSILVDDAGAGLRFTRAGEHFVIFTEGPDGPVVARDADGEARRQRPDFRLARPEPDHLRPIVV